MRTLQLSIVAGSLLTTGLLICRTASAVELCDHLGRSCEDGCYTSVFKKAIVLPSSPSTGDSTCDNVALSMSTSGSYISYELPLDIAPGPMALECSGRYCEVWPQGDSITYSWSASGIALDAASGAANPVRGFSCTPGTQGTIIVTAFSPRGASETLTQTVSCQ